MIALVVYFFRRCETNIVCNIYCTWKTSHCIITMHACDMCERCIPFQQKVQIKNNQQQRGLDGRTDSNDTNNNDVIDEYLF